ncbi:MAG: hypothetical protein HUU25_10985 [Candidatus Sumerlaeia bacterium]|nr:hypothetical protein [Candidatus Sumerlaeia bacterium]
MIRIGFHLCAWGILPALVSLTVGGIDTLPDAAGYLAIACGASLIRHLDGGFRAVLSASLVLMPLSLSQYFEADPSRWLGFIGPLQTLVAAGALAVAWQLAASVRAASRRAMQAELAARAEMSRWAIVYLVAALLATAALSAAFEALATAAAIIVFALRFALAAIVFTLLRSAGDILGEPPQDGLPVPAGDPA